MNQNNRKQIRLPEFDYSQNGYYFVTICTHHRKPLFGEIVNGRMTFKQIGEFAENCWLDIPNHFPHVSLDEFVIMPNHVHGILIIDWDNVGVQNFEPLQENAYLKIIPKSLGSIIRGFKIGVTKLSRNVGFENPVWQRSFHDHVIRNEKSLEQIREYILNNPAAWEDDEYYL